KEYVKELEKEAREILKEMLEISDLEVLMDSLSRYTGLLSDYSPFNAILIESHDPHFTIVRSEQEWNRFGYKLKKDAKGIPILVPIGGGKKVMPGEVLKFIEEKRAEGLSDEMIEHLVNEKFQNKFVHTHNFRVGFVYDKKDVEPDPKKKQIQEWDISPTNEEMYNMAKAFAEKHFKVIEGNVKDARGVSYGGVIQVLKAPGETKEAVNTILHEIAHEMLGHHKTKLSREAKELEAELTAYLVAKNYGIDLKNYAKTYLKAWWKNGGYKHFGENNLDRVLKTAHEIIQGINEANFHKLTKSEIALEMAIPEEL
ncbi:MAG: hypothetical protein C0180_04895, partial [Aciduliprofundum sp.]